MASWDDQFVRSPTGWKRVDELEAGPPPEREYADWEIHTKADEDRQRHEWDRKTLLDSVSNPTARSILEELHRAATKKNKVLPWRRCDYDYLKGLEWVNDDVRDYRDWVRKRLKTSDLAYRIPAGFDALPDIQDAMREPWKSIERLRAPRNYKQLIQHLIRHLDWYLDPTRTVKPPVSEIRSYIDGIVTIVGCMFAPALFLIWGIVSRLIAWIWGGHKLDTRRVSQYHHLKEDIHATELFYYLAEKYPDQEEEPTG